MSEKATAVALDDAFPRDEWLSADLEGVVVLRKQDGETTANMGDARLAADCRRRFALELSLLRACAQTLGC